MAGRVPGRAYTLRMARIAVLVASDKGAAGARVDVSGETIVVRCRQAGHLIVRHEIVPDDRALLARTLAAWADESAAEVILTTGGTGLTPRDVTPEATRDIGERDVPGIPLALALAGLEKTPYAVLSRGIAVTRGSTLIVNLAGSPKAVDEGLDVLLPLIPHIAELLSGPFEHAATPNSG